MSEVTLEETQIETPAPAPAPKVVNVRQAKNHSYIYIGRSNPRFPKGSPFANPFKIGVDGGRAEVLAKYREWLASQPALIDRARLELAGHDLGCWCAPEPCHGNILLEFINAASQGSDAPPAPAALLSESESEAAPDGPSWVQGGLFD